MDRLDYTKGIIKRLEAFDQFLHKYPKYHEKVTLILVAVPSRTGVETYMLLKKELDELIGKINGEHGGIGWVPVWYLYRYLTFHTLAALYYIADVALVTPIRDGMNLIAKEFTAAKDEDGVLILSEFAGAAEELNEAILVNPYDLQQTAGAIKTAVEMPLWDKIQRFQSMKKKVEKFSAQWWLNNFLDEWEKSYA